MKTKLSLIIFALFAVGLFTTAGALTSSQVKRVLILGDRTCAGSTDSTIVAATAPENAYTYATGLYAAPDKLPDTDFTKIVPYKAVRDSKYGAQTMVDGMHAAAMSTFSTMSADVKALIYTIYVDESPISQWNFDKLPGEADVVVWMHGSLEYGTSQADYAAGLERLVAKYPGCRIVFVQPGNGGAVFASRTAAAEYSMPSFTVENAMLEVCRNHRSTKIAVVNPARVEYGDDGRTPRASSMALLGRTIAEAFTGNAGEVFEPHCTAKSNEVVVTLAGANIAGIDTITIAPAPALGFEIWRGTGNAARRLNIVKANGSGPVTLTTNEPVTRGDYVVYGTGDGGSGPMNGRRGNIADSRRALPHFSCEITDVDVADANITGRITCDGAGVPGVAVSDGYVITYTDSEGRYAFASQKKNGYVFYTLPAGYEPQTEANGWQIRNFAHLTAPANVETAEVHDFVLNRVDNDNHIMVVGADTHLAARVNDKKQFKNGFVAKMKALREANPDARIYSTILGDLTWDEFWYSNNYALPDFVKTMTDDAYPFMLFPVMGNHDNDGATPAGPTCDFDAAAPFRATIAPTYYSYNLGKVHYVVLDDIIYKNTVTAGKDYSTGIVGDRNYGQYYTDEQLEWLRRDLEGVVDKSTPIVVCLHIQNWALSTHGQFTVNANLNNGASEALARVLSDFADVTILSGHTHYNFHAHPPMFPNIHENNVAAICATWWWTDKMVGRHICKDGSPGGYAIYTAKGKDLSWKFHSIEDNGDAQMRIYDMNAVKNAFRNDADIKAYLAYDATRPNYSNIDDNLVYINVFNYDTDWTVEVREGDTLVEATRITAADPLHFICYEVPRYKAAGKVTNGYKTNNTNHMFRVRCATADAPVTVRLVDSFGNEYTQTLVRPGVYDTTIP